VLRPVRLVYDLVSDLVPGDQLEAAHRVETLRWLETTDDIYRRHPPMTPPRHLVAYMLLVDNRAGAMLLVDHIMAGLWLPAGGHVEPGERPIDTVLRETKEELGIDAAFHPVLGERPVFVTSPRRPGARTSTPTSASGSCSMRAEVWRSPPTLANSVPRVGGLGSISLPPILRCSTRTWAG
jgi:8-oxo-dGTP diphosphatase